jgi:GNAT superfamily N-acetyltransferase
MDEETPHIEVRAVRVTDVPALCKLDYNFETDRIYTLRMRNHLLQDDDDKGQEDRLALSFELIETAVDPPLYKDFREEENRLTALERRVRDAEGGYVALMDGEVAGAILLRVGKWRPVAHIQDIIVGRQYQRYGIGTLLLNCAADWARERKCWSLVLHTQSTNYPAIQFYLRNGLEIWSISRNFYPPGSSAHNIAIFMGKRLSPSTE